MKALLIVDLQKDFLPGGALAVPKGDEIIPIINQLLSLPFDLIVATKDWHPSDHGSFADNYNKKPGEHVTLSGLDQILWPRHCVQGSEGSNFAPNWNVTQVDKIVYKGTEKDIDSYSTFFDNGHLKSTGLEDYLKERGITEIFIVGLATDYCVKYSVMDALKLGFKTYVIIDACRGVNLQPNDTKEALQLIARMGATLIHSSEVKSYL